MKTYEGPLYFTLRFRNGKAAFSVSAYGAGGGVADEEVEWQAFVGDLGRAVSARDGTGCSAHACLQIQLHAGRHSVGRPVCGAASGAIRDSSRISRRSIERHAVVDDEVLSDRGVRIDAKSQVLADGGAVACCCLLYTSDAADDLLCVDLGGRRII